MLHELNRLRAEYLEMPGLRLKREQAQRLCGLERTVCQSALDSLVNTRFLYLQTDGTYARLIDGAVVPQPANAAVSADHWGSLKAS
jgi:hypothetical protein